MSVYKELNCHWEEEVALFYVIPEGKFGTGNGNSENQFLSNERNVLLEKGNIVESRILVP